MAMIKIYSSSSLIIFLLATIILCHAFILTKLIFFPYPEFFIYPYLTNQGLKPYAQILDQHFPGLMFLPLNLNNLGMDSPEIARIWLIGIVLVTHLLLFLVAKKIFKNGFKALLINVLYLVWQPFFEGWIFWIDNFIPIFTLSAFYFTYRYFFEKEKNTFIFLSGLFLGLGIMFKQTVLPLAGIIFLYLLWQSRSIKVLSIYSIGISIPIVFTLIYFLNLGVINDLWYWTIVFNLTAYSQQGLQVERPLGYFTRILLVFGTSSAAIFSKQKKETILILLFLAGSLFGAFDRLDFVHLQPSLPFALLATGLGFETLSKGKFTRYFLVFYLLTLMWWISIFLKGHLSNKIIFFDESIFAQAEKIRQYTNPGDKIFLFALAPHLYQITQTLPAGNIFVFQFPWFMVVAQDRILDGLIADPPKLVVYEEDAVIEGQKATDFMNKISQYIEQNFTQIDRVGKTRIMRKKTL